jgi:hypothetical protein
MVADEAMPRIELRVKLLVLRMEADVDEATARRLAAVRLVRNIVKDLVVSDREVVMDCNWRKECPADGSGGLDREKIVK